MTGLQISISNVIGQSKIGDAAPPPEPNFVIAENNDQVITEGGDEIITQN
jgi:hypothetical protein